jgi:hypothetical protein
MRVVHAALVGAGHDDARDTMRAGALEHRRDIVPERTMGKIGADVDELRAHAVSLPVCPNRAAHYANIGARPAQFRSTNSPPVNRAGLKLTRIFFLAQRGTTMSSIAVSWRGPALAAIALACATSAFAAEGGANRSVSASQVMAARQAALVTAQTLNRSARGTRQAVTAAAGTNQPSEIYANPFRAYPPSCLGDGLPFRTYPQSNGDPAPQQQSLTLPGDPGQCFGGGNAQECNYSEAVTVTVWRVACSSNQTAVLVEIDRSAANEGNTTLYPTFPLVEITQGNSTLSPVRMLDDPNTFYATTSVNTALYSSDIYVLENYNNDQATQIDYTKGFVLSLDRTITFTLPDYDRTKFGAGMAPLEISGYVSTNWFDALHSGEGMLTQIYDGGDQATRFFTAAWYTFDPLGLPFWLYAQGSVDIGARAANNVAVYYATNGGFAGNFPAGNATFTQWGTANFSFPDCNTMTFSYNGHTDAQTNGPGGSGTRTWTRLANINSLVCN